MTLGFMLFYEMGVNGSQASLSKSYFQVHQREHNGLQSMCTTNINSLG